jgi:ParB-like chromosome segregation protein Spo0J
MTNMEIIFNNKNQTNMKEKILSLIPNYEFLSNDEKIDIINEIKIALHEISPMRNEPVDCVLWVKNDNVKANDYNPNSVAPPEMELLRQSIMEDGYTQPIVSFKEDSQIIVIDGFHRNRVGKEVEEVRNRVYGRLPVVNINQWKQGRSDRMASTIRHNRARGSHNIELMSTIVSELVEMGKGDAWICKHVGMSKDELLRMKQITGLASLFQNKAFSNAWESDISISESDFE